MSLKLFDTHTHFDVPEFDEDRIQLAYSAKEKGVEGLILIGFVQSRFDDLRRTHEQFNSLQNVPKSYLAPGLHPFYIEQHTQAHLNDLEIFLREHKCVAIGEIGLDTFLKHHKVAEIFAKQIYFFNQQLELAKLFNKPVLLHIRKSHADVLKILKQHKFQQGGIAHAFGGGIQEAKAFVDLGFKIGVTGQITNSNARKLHEVVNFVGIKHLVLETDCPDMAPHCCHDRRNTPANLPYVLEGLSQVLKISSIDLAEQLWKNTFQALCLEKA